MSKLKTLNDFRRKDFDPKVFPELLARNQTLDVLKQEAIKWVKHYQKLKEEGKNVGGRIDFIKIFFNITEEDLK